MFRFHMIIYTVLLMCLLLPVSISLDEVALLESNSNDSNDSSLRDWLATLNKQASDLDRSISLVESIISILSEANVSSLLTRRYEQLEKMKRAREVLTDEVQVISSACTSFGGPDCTIPICNSRCLDCRAPQQCSVCSDNWDGSTCSLCKTGWNGTDCNIIICDGKCSNCSGPNQCSECSGNWDGSECSNCKIGWSGSECNIPECDSKCKNCTAPSECLECSGNWNGNTCSSCKSGWIGSTCDIPVCDSKCLNCIAPGHCSACSGNWNGTTCSECKSGWGGINCTTPVCDSKCLTCVSPNQCSACLGNWNGSTCSSCNSGWGGTNCADPVCNNKCTTCVSPGQCSVCSGNWNGATCSTCKTGWSGTNCDIQQLLSNSGAYTLASGGLRSCNQYKSVFNTASSGLYWIKPDATKAEFKVYCEQSFNGGGWALISSRTNSKVPYYNDLVNPVNDGSSLRDDKWAMLKSTSSDIMWRDVNNYAVSSISMWASSGNCKPLTSKLTDAYLAHIENSGCNLSGTDYCVLGHNVAAYNSYLYGYCGTSRYSTYTFGYVAALTKANVYVR